MEKGQHGGSSDTAPGRPHPPSGGTGTGAIGGSTLSDDGRRADQTSVTTSPSSSLFFGKFNHFFYQRGWDTEKFYICRENETIRLVGYLMPMNQISDL